jgi:hypothetical protein
MVHVKLAFMTGEVTGTKTAYVLYDRPLKETTELYIRHPQGDTPRLSILLHCLPEISRHQRDPPACQRRGAGEGQQSCFDRTL